MNKMSSRSQSHLYLLAVTLAMTAIASSACIRVPVSPAPLPATTTQPAQPTGKPVETPMPTDVTVAPTSAPTQPTDMSANLSVSLGSHSVGVSSTVPISIVLTSSDQVAGGSLKIEFDNSILAVNDVSPGDFGIPITFTDTNKGIVSIAVAQAVASGKSQAILAVLSMRGVSPGKTGLRITYVELNDATGSLITPMFEDGLVSVK